MLVHAPALGKLSYYIISSYLQFQKNVPRGSHFPQVPTTTHSQSNSRLWHDQLFKLIFQIGKNSCLNELVPTYPTQSSSIGCWFLLQIPSSYFLHLPINYRLKLNIQLTGSPISIVSFFPHISNLTSDTKFFDVWIQTWFLNSNNRYSNSLSLIQNMCGNWEKTKKVVIIDQICRSSRKKIVTLYNHRVLQSLSINYGITLPPNTASLATGSPFQVLSVLTGMTGLRQDQGRCFETDNPFPPISPFEEARLE